MAWLNFVLRTVSTYVLSHQELTCIFFSSLNFCLLSSRLRISFLHTIPFRMMRSSAGEKTMYNNPTMKKAHPEPMALIMGMMIAVPAAPRRQRVRLLAATAAPALPGVMSISRTVRENVSLFRLALVITHERNY